MRDREPWFADLREAVGEMDTWAFDPQRRVRAYKRAHAAMRLLEPVVGAAYEVVAFDRGRLSGPGWEELVAALDTLEAAHSHERAS